MQQKTEIKPRSPRVLGSSLRSAIFTFDDHPTLGLVIHNLSASGLALDNFPNDKFNVGTNFKAKLALNNLDLALNLILVRKISATNAAFMFEPAPYQLANYIIQCFPYELRGQKLIKVAANSLKSDSFGEPHWFYDGRENELYYLLDKEKIVYFRISLNGKYIEKYADYPIQVRKYNAQSSIVEKPGTKTVDEMIQLSDNDIKQIITFIQHIRFLDQDKCNKIVSMLQL